MRELTLGKEGDVGLITYMRTDSTRIADSAIEETKSFIETTYGKEFLAAAKTKSTSKAKDSDKPKSQDAHEAVRPTSVMRPPAAMKDFLSRDQYRSIQTHLGETRRKPDGACRSRYGEGRSTKWRCPFPSDWITSEV